jgi:hypothetical protein
MAWRRYSRHPKRSVVCAAVTLAFLGLTTLARAQTVDLSSRSAEEIGGARHGDEAGVSVAGGAHVNGDALPDLIVGASGADRGGRNSGAVYVVFGKRRVRGLDLRRIGHRGLRIDGAHSGDHAGLDVADAGDVNGDGRDDILVGALRADVNGPQSGAAYVVFGTHRRRPLDLAHLGRHGFRIEGPTARANAGVSVAGAGDVNEDGLDDVVVGSSASPKGRRAAGAAYVVFGKPSRGAVNLGALGPHGYQIDGAKPGDQAGLSVAGLGDVNGDGLPDLGVGAPYASFKDRYRSGIAYVVFGTATPTNIDLRSLGARGFELGGSSGPSCGMCTSVFAGTAIAGAGDVNGDGRDDVEVAEPNSHDNGIESSGSVYMIFGRSLTSPIDLAELGERGLRIEGPRVGSEVGQTLGGGADVNGDGRPDLLLGSPLANYNGPGSGSVYAVKGRTRPGKLALANPSASIMRIDGARRGDSAGPVSPAGDVNGDGHADLLVGAPLHDFHGRTHAGAAYLVLGR